MMHGKIRAANNRRRMGIRSWGTWRRSRPGIDGARRSSHSSRRPDRTLLRPLRRRLPLPPYGPGTTDSVRHALRRLPPRRKPYPAMPAPALRRLHRRRRRRRHRRQDRRPPPRPRPPRKDRARRPSRLRSFRATSSPSPTPSRPASRSTTLTRPSTIGSGWRRCGEVS